MNTEQSPQHIQAALSAWRQYAKTGSLNPVDCFLAGYTARDAEVERLTQALDGMLCVYVSLVNSGDAGNWNPENEPEVKAARQALAPQAEKQPQ